VQNLSTSNSSAAAANSKATAIFREAATAGRETLSDAEMRALLSSLDLQYDAGAASATVSPDAELRIDLSNTREFGVVISAGLGGLDAGLADDNLRQDRASVHAAAGLTDAADFLELFRRTFAYRKLALIAERDGRAPPDELLRSLFGRLLELASIGAPGHPASPFVLQTLTLDPIEIRDVLIPPELQDGIAEFLKCVRARQDGASTELPDLPPPLAEQRWIVAKMEELAAKIEEARGLQQQTMEDAWTLLDSTRATIFKKMSSSWKVQKLDEVAPINMGQSPPGGTYNTFGDGIPLLNGPTEFGEKFPTPIQWTTAPTKLCKPGDILLCVRASVGRMNWAEKEYCIGRGLAALTPDPKVCLPEYVYYFVETQTQEMLKLAAGSTFPNLPGAKLKVLEIPVPPILEQRRVVAYLDSIQKKIMPLKHLQSQTAAELEALLPSILDKAFKGEL